jgi:hypothetical protein
MWFLNQSQRFILISLTLNFLLIFIKIIVLSLLFFLRKLFLFLLISVRSHVLKLLAYLIWLYHNLRLVGVICRFLFLLFLILSLLIFNGGVSILNLGPWLVSNSLGINATISNIILLLLLLLVLFFLFLLCLHFFL